MKSVIILSGGMDSAVLLAQRLKDGDIIHCLTFNYGSKHNKRENLAALKLCEYYGVKTNIIQMPFINRLFKSELLSSDGEIPEGHYEDESMKKTVVPFRNGIMLSIAAGYAESIEAKKLYFGAHSGDHAIYPDCRNPFVVAFAESIYNGTYLHLQLEAPFIQMTKREIGLLGIKMGVPFELTYSCYKGNEKHCGKCGTCVERKEALLGFDKTEYE